MVMISWSIGQIWVGRYLIIPFLLCFCSVTGSFGLANGILGGLLLTKNMNHGSTDVPPRCNIKYENFWV